MERATKRWSILLVGSMIVSGFGCHVLGTVVNNQACSLTGGCAAPCFNTNNGGPGVKSIKVIALPEGSGCVASTGSNCDQTNDGPCGTAKAYSLPNCGGDLMTSTPTQAGSCTPTIG